jgi:hypothetical protein
LILKNWNQRFSDSEKFQNTGTGGSWISKFFKRPKPEVVIRNQITPNTDIYMPKA